MRLLVTDMPRGCCPVAGMRPEILWSDVTGRPAQTSRRQELRGHLCWEASCVVPVRRDRCTSKPGRGWPPLRTSARSVSQLRSDRHSAVLRTEVPVPGTRSAADTTAQEPPLLDEAATRY